MASILANVLLKEHGYKINSRMDTNREVISRLKFISRINKQDKINTRHVYVQPSGIMTTLSRTFLNPDNRGNALTFVQETVMRAFEIISTFERSEREADRTMVICILKDLHQSKIGLSNLKNTYATDLKLNADLDTLIQDIDVKLAALAPKYPLTEDAPPNEPYPNITPPPPPRSDVSPSLHRQF